MKLYIAAFLPLAATAFAPGASFVRPSTSLNVDIRPDTSDLVAKAMAASEEFGATSREARLAWETVEEMDASTNLSDAMAIDAADEECDADSTSEECMDYGEKLDELAVLIKESAQAMDRVKNVAMEVKAIKMKPATAPTKVAGDNPVIEAALQAAKDATEKHGIKSSEARLAWEELEEVTAAQVHSEGLAGKIDEECLTDMIEACEAMEEIKRVFE